jgi:hypothetical protein
MSFRKSLAVAMACCLVVAGAQIAATAHGGAIHGSFGPAFGHGFYGGHSHSFYWRGFGRDFHHSRHDHFPHYFFLHDFGHWHGYGGDRFWHWQPGHWHAASGFGAGGHWHEDGVWHR